jgi:hypothetical protein
MNLTPPVGAIGPALATVTVKVTGYQWKWNYDYLEDGIAFYSNLSTPRAQIENVADRFLHDGMVAANVENRITAEEIQVGVVIHVVQVSAFSPGIDLVETNHALGRDQGAIDMSMMQLVIFAEPRCNDFFQVKRHSRMFSDLGGKSKRGHRDQRSPLQLFLETIRWIEQSLVRDSINHARGGVRFEFRFHWFTANATL